MLTEKIVNKSELPSFLRWAGGKRWFVEKHWDLLPKQFNCYFEPFLGGGAVFFGMTPTRAILSDVNKALINTYRMIRDDPHLVMTILKEHDRHHCKEYYIKVRNSTPYCKVKQAARFIYLIRTCWNGLYRVNKSGDFNVPIGTKERALLQNDDFEKISTVLKNVELHSCDFEETVFRAKNKDLVFLDPPYSMVKQGEKFNKYNTEVFSWEDQVRLAKAAFRAKSRGARIIMTNVDCEEIQALYENDFEIKRLHRQSTLAANSIKRGKYTELLIMG